MRRACCTSEAVPGPPGNATTSTETEWHGEERAWARATAADRPGGPPVALPLGRQNERRPAQLTGGAGDGGISAAGTAMEQEMDSTAAAAGQQLSGHPLMGPGQIPTAARRDHQAAAGALLGPG
jgi:hypothetical protein